MGGGKVMTQGTEWKQILLFTLPIMLGQLLQQLYNAVDGLIVGNFVNQDALAAVGTCAPVTMLFIAIALGMSTGCSVMIAQYYGAGRTDELRRGVSTSLILLVGMGVVFTVVGVGVSRVLLERVLAVEAVQLPDAVAYFSIYCLGLVFQFIYNIVAALLRALGDSAATLYFLLVSSVTNILLDLLFVLVFHWNVPGVAIATVIAQALSAAVSLVYMFRRYKIFRFQKGEFRFHRDMGITALRLGIPTTLQQCVISSGHIAIQRLVNTFKMTAAMTAAARIESFIFIPIFSFNAGLATFTGQNLGAGKLERVRRGLHGTWVMGLIVAVTSSVAVFLFAGPLARSFGVEGENLAIAKEYLRFICGFLWMFSIFIVCNGVLQGAGDVVYTAVNTITSLIVRVVLTYLAAYFTPLGRGVIWYMLPIGWLYSLVLSLARYKWGPWHKKTVVQEEQG